MFDTVKQHPYLFGGTAIVAVIVLFAMRGSSASQATTGSTADIAGAQALQQAQMQLNSQAGQQATALQAQGEQDATALALAKIQSDTSTNANTLAAAVASKQLDVNQTLGTQSNTLSAQIASDNNATRVKLAGISADAQSTQLADVVAALTVQSQTQLQAMQSQQAAQVQMMIAQQAANNRPGGFFKNLFG